MCIVWCTTARGVSTEGFSPLLPPPAVLLYPRSPLPIIPFPHSKLRTAKQVVCVCVFPSAFVPNSASFLHIYMLPLHNLLREKLQAKERHTDVEIMIGIAPTGAHCQYAHCGCDANNANSGGHLLTSNEQNSDFGKILDTRSTLWALSQPP